MKGSPRLVVMLALCGLLAMGAGAWVFAADDDAAGDAKVITLKGVAVWQGKRANVTAVLTPTRDKDYDVVYTFTWSERNHTYYGRIKGNLKRGTVRGTGAPRDKARTFIVRAKASRKGIIGKHYETTGGKTKLTGDIHLKLQG